MEEKYQGKCTVGAKRDIQRLKRGEHLAYVIGFVSFLGCKIDLSQKPFIPRPETEYWVEKAIDDIRKLKIDCLDIFAGSGCVGIAVLKHVPNAVVDFAEKNRRFLKQIEINAKLNHIVPQQYRIIHSDIFRDITGRYDFILANPPYLATSRKHQVQKSVVENEPSQALFAGSDGLRYIRRFLREARDYLKEEGKIYMEFDAPQKKEIEKLLKKYSYQNFKIFKDQYGKWRYVVVDNE